MVCCGRCEYSFNALSNIQESASEAIANIQPVADPAPEPRLTDNPELQDVISDPAHRKLWEDAESAGLSAEDTWSSEHSDEQSGDEESGPDPDDTGQYEGSPADDGGQDGDGHQLLEDAEDFEAAVLATIHATEAREWESSGPHFVGENVGDDEQESDRDSASGRPGDSGEERTDDGQPPVLALEIDEPEEGWDIDDRSLEGIEQPEDLTVTELALEEPETDTGSVETGDEDRGEPLPGQGGDAADKNELTLEQQLEASYLSGDPDTAADGATGADVGQETDDPELLSAGESGANRADTAPEQKDEAGDDGSLAFLDQLAEGVDEENVTEDLLGLSVSEDDAETNEDETDGATESPRDDDAEARDIWLGEVTPESADSGDAGDIDDAGATEESATEQGDDQPGTRDEAEAIEDAPEDDEAAGGDTASTGTSVEITTGEDDDQDNEIEVDEDDGSEEIILSGDDLDDDETDEQMDRDHGADADVQDEDEFEADEDDEDDEDDESDQDSGDDDYGTEEIVLEGDGGIFDGETRADPYVAPSGAGRSSVLHDAGDLVRRITSKVAAGALVLLLLLQVVHGFRYELAKGDMTGPMIESLYELIGMPLGQQYDIDDYEIRRVIAVGDESGSGVVEISAILSNRADRAQPYPSLRLVFTDQFDEVLAVRDLIPSEYMDTPPARGATMVSGEQIAVDIRVRELENALAANYQLEICLREPDQTLVCR